MPRSHDHVMHFPKKKFIQECYNDSLNSLNSPHQCTNSIPLQNSLITTEIMHIIPYPAYRVRIYKKKKIISKSIVIIWLFSKRKLMIVHKN